MLEVGRLKPPKDIVESIEKEARRVEEFTKSRKIRFSESKISEMEQDIAKKIRACRNQTRPMRRRLVELNDLLEGVVEETNFPFEGASNITLHYAAGMMATFRSNFNRTRFQDPNIFSASIPLGEDISYDINEIKDLEDAVNYTFHTDSNGLETLKEAIVPCVRDGTTIIQGFWSRRIEKGNDSKTYKNGTDFINDYPSATDAGLEPDAYDRVLDMFVLSGDDEKNPFEYRADFKYDFVDYDGPEYEIVSLANFLFWPVYAPNIRRMEIYGGIRKESPTEVKIKGRRGEYYENRVSQVLSQVKGFEDDQWSASRNFIEGLSPSLEDHQPIDVADLVYKCDSDDDGIPEKYLVTFALKSEKILCVEDYPLRKNIDFCVDFRMQKRDGRFLAPSLLGDTEDLFRLMDAIHNNRNNVRMLVTSPILMIPDVMKETLDLGRSENVVRPGLTFWVKDMNNRPQQLVLQNLDQPGNSLDEENLVVRYIELRFGPTQGMSGKETPMDPKAPMGKTLALMRQAGVRIDDYGDEFEKSYPALAELHRALYYQYGKGKILYTVDKEGKPVQKSVSNKLFGLEGIKFRAKRRSVTLSPEFTMQRIGGLIQVYSSLLPLLNAKDSRAIELWNRMVISSEEPEFEKLIIKEQTPAEMGSMPQMPGSAAQTGMQALLGVQAAPQPIQPSPVTTGVS